MEIFGKIIAVLPERNGTSQRGNQWRSVTYVLETQEQYPKKLTFDVVNEKIDQLAIQPGEMLNVQFDINAREYNGKWFNSIQAWNVVRQQPGGQQMSPQGSYQQPIQGGYQQPQQSWGQNNPQAGYQAAQQAPQNVQGQQFPPQQPPQSAQGQGGDPLPF